MGAVVVLAACGGGGGSGSPQGPVDLSPSVAPGGNFAMDHWSLTIPADATGGTGGQAQTIVTAQLQGPQGYSSQWFQTASDGSVVFYVPHNGAADSEQAPHPRSELREQIVTGSNRDNWDEFGASILEADLRIDSVPSDNTVIIGQVHGVAVSPLIVLSYQYDPAATFGRVFGLVHSTPDLGSPFVKTTLLDGVRLGDRLTYRVTVINGVATMAVNGNAPTVTQIDPSWSQETFYFKSGAYLNSATTGSDAAQVRYYKIAASHPNEGLDISTGSPLPQATAGASYAAQLAATAGAPPYQWSLASGQLPAGLTMDASGLIQGSPDRSAVSSLPHHFTVIVRDSHNNSLAKTVDLRVQ